MTTMTVPRPMYPVRALRHGITLTWHSLAKTRRNPERLADVAFQPIVFITGRSFKAPA